MLSSPPDTKTFPGRRLAAGRSVQDKASAMKVWLRLHSGDMPVPHDNTQLKASLADDPF